MSSAKILDIATTLIKLPEENAWVIKMVNNILIEVLGSIAEEERIKIRVRQEEGIYKGRKPSVLPKNFPSLYNRWKEGNITAVEFTTLLGYKSRNTTYRKIRQY